jgi:hypothetical protein
MSGVKVGEKNKMLHVPCKEMNQGRKKKERKRGTYKRRVRNEGFRHVSKCCSGG